MKIAMDNRHGTTLVLIDFSTAFDTVNQNIMIRQLQLCYDFVGKTLAWMQSYLEGRTQRVVIRDASLNLLSWRTLCWRSGTKCFFDYQFSRIM